VLICRVERFRRVQVKPGTQPAVVASVDGEPAVVTTADSQAPLLSRLTVLFALVLFFAAASTRLGPYARSMDLARSGDHVSHYSHGDPGHLPDRALIDVHPARGLGSWLTPGG
jgi:hypothetical protein